MHVFLRGNGLFIYSSAKRKTNKAKKRGNSYQDSSDENEECSSQALKPRIDSMESNRNPKKGTSPR